jgi:hypothetical protein
VLRAGPPCRDWYLLDRPIDVLGEVEARNRLVPGQFDVADKIANVLNALPKSAQPGAKTALAEIWNAEDRDHAQTAARTFADTYGATVRLRQRVTKGPGSRAAGIAVAFRLIESAQRRWRAVNAPHLVALVRAGAHFDKGRIVERPSVRAFWGTVESLSRAHRRLVGCVRQRSPRLTLERPCHTFNEFVK